MGPQSPLPLPHKNRRPISDPLSFALLPPPPRTSSLLLPHRDLPHHSPRILPFALLDTHERKPKGYCSLGNTTEPVPPRSSGGLHRSFTVRKPQWTFQDTSYFKTDKHWRYCGGARWKVWGYSASRRLDELCQGTRGSVHLAMHVLLV